MDTCCICELAEGVHDGNTVTRSAVRCVNAHNEWCCQHCYEARCKYEVFFTARPPCAICRGRLYLDAAELEKADPYAELDYNVIRVTIPRPTPEELVMGDRLTHEMRMAAVLRDIQPTVQLAMDGYFRSYGGISDCGDCGICGMCRASTDRRPTIDDLIRRVDSRGQERNRPAMDRWARANDLLEAARIRVMRETPEGPGMVDRLMHELAMAEVLIELIYNDCGDCGNCGVCGYLYGEDPESEDRSYGCLDSDGGSCGDCSKCGYVADRYPSKRYDEDDGLDAMTWGLELAERWGRAAPCTCGGASGAGRDDVGGAAW
jgi:hypothetical protein